MNTHKLFQTFNTKIKLSREKRDELKKNRNALRDKIRRHFEDNKWPNPYFYSQGSFPLETNLNPIKKTDSEGNTTESYDLDDGVYFRCPLTDRKTEETYHSRIYKAVVDHAKNTVNKNTCVRVEYADGHNIDLPCYWHENDGDTPHLAHISKGFTESDPKEFISWVNHRISNAGNNGQLRKIIRYIKAWVDWRQHNNSSIRLPSGFVWTILACNNYVSDERDDIAFHKTMKAINDSFFFGFVCHRPTTPVGEELLASKYQSDVVLPELEKLLERAEKAIDSNCERKASEYWQKVFGDRFPLGKKNQNSGAGRYTAATGGATLPPAVGGTKPFLSLQESRHQTSHIQNMHYSDSDFKMITQYFPGLKYDGDKNLVVGNIGFCAKYIQKKDGSWEIIAQNSECSKEVFCGDFSIVIDLNLQRPQPKVYEEGNQIGTTAKRLGLPMIDLHINRDGSFCLDYVSTIKRLNIPLSKFILHKIYPFLVWQAYYNKFEKKPPLGDYPHDYTADQIFEQEIKKFPRNAKCYCGSGEKYKHCCLRKHNA